MEESGHESNANEVCRLSCIVSTAAGKWKSSIPWFRFSSCPLLILAITKEFTSQWDKEKGNAFWTRIRRMWLEPGCRLCVYTSGKLVCGATPGFCDGWLFWLRSGMGKEEAFWLLKLLIWSWGSLKRTSIHHGRNYTSCLHDIASNGCQTFLGSTMHRHRLRWRKYNAIPPYFREA